MLFRSWEKNFNSVVVKNGNFQVILQGQGDNSVQLETALKDLEAAYVEIKVGTEAPLVPRQPLLRSPFASSDKIVSKTDVLVQSDSQSSGSGLITMRTGSADRLTILNNGNVGVGTVSPTEKLEIGGRVKDKTGYLMPVGSVISYVSSTPPQGWLVCNGQTVARNSYADLFEIVGCTFGCPDGNTFKVPDLRGEFVRGFDAGRGVDVGREFGAPQAAGTNTLSYVQINSAGSYASPPSVNVPQDGTLSGTVYSGSSSGNVNWHLQFKLSGAETRPRNVALSYIIRY